MATRARAPIVEVTAAVLLVLVALAGWSAGYSEEGVRIVVRWTAKIALLLFSAAFAASSLRVFFRGETTRWLMLHRRRLGLGFALTHTVHLFALILLGFAFPSPFVDELTVVTLVGGGLAYLLMFAMAATSNDASVRKLGVGRWRALHLVGSWSLFIVFAQSYFLRVVYDLAYIPFALVLLLVAGLRVARWSRQRARSSARTAAAAPSR